MLYLSNPPLSECYLLQSGYLVLMTLNWSAALQMASYKAVPPLAFTDSTNFCRKNWRVKFISNVQLQIWGKNHTLHYLIVSLKIKQGGHNTNYTFTFTINVNLTLPFLTVPLTQRVQAAYCFGVRSVSYIAPRSYVTAVSCFWLS